MILKFMGTFCPDGLDKKGISIEGELIDKEN